MQVAALGIFNSLQSYTTLSMTQRVYSGAIPNIHAPKRPLTNPVTPLSARTFGTWTFLVSIVRLYAAYNIQDPAMYQIALWTYLVALSHFASEWLIFGTAKLNAGLAAPVLVASGSLIWMLTVWGGYVQ